MARAIVFDVNETLLDLRSLEPHFERLFGDGAVMHQWFARVLHTSLVATLTESYVDFATIAGAALDITAAREAVTLAATDRQQIAATLQSLPPHDDVKDGLEQLRSAGLRLAALTNSATDMVETQLSHAGLREYFELALTVDEVRRFKPAPEVYEMAASRLGVEIGQIRMVAAHDWDVFGALSAGCAAAFVARPGASYNSLYEEPDVTGPDLRAVAVKIIDKEL